MTDFDLLFDVARESPGSPSERRLAEEDREHVIEIRQLLEAIASAWELEDGAADRLKMRFLEKLAVRNPAHPWVLDRNASTLGELIAVGGKAAPILPEASWKALASDLTPIEELIDPAERPAAFGKALLRAEVPTTLIAELSMWLNRALVTYMPAPSPKMTFARRQPTRKRNDSS